MYTVYASARGVSLSKSMNVGSTLQAGAPPVGPQAQFFGNREKHVGKIKAKEAFSDPCS
ncbi:hypothetical protein KUW17_16785 [Leisingera aquaemixtae]|uniref:hypothetical protein n=1 Tax=Leisingera aquaemixtae TaxID=1396826 RepID=UPI001C955554|nr:hypothetical protein [Leisingera aquaemixtae]MBY6068406.1 hypothetical protein [Leisingera aquaemixtae]